MDKTYIRNEIVNIINSYKPTGNKTKYSKDEIEVIFSKMLVEIVIFMSTDN